MVDESVLYFVANLALFALLLLSWVRLLRPTLVTGGMFRATRLFFLCCQGIALLWSVARLGPWSLAHPYLSVLLLVEATIIAHVVLEKLGPDGGAGPIVITSAFVMDTFGIVLLAAPVPETLQVSPFVRSPWYLVHLVTALIAFSTYTGAAGGAVAYFAAPLLTRSRLAAEQISTARSGSFTLRALRISFPWLSASVVAAALWTQLAWGSYWTWRAAEVWLLILWLVSTMTLHAHSMPAWQGKLLPFLSLLGFGLALLSLPLLGQGLVTTS